MTRMVPISEVAHLRLALPADMRWISGLGWIPVTPTEIHLASRYYPIAIRIEQQTAQIGLILDQTYLTHALLDAAGAWRGAYRPIGLRCFPFSAPSVSDDPLSDIHIDADSEYLSAASGTPIVDGDGRPAPLLRELHRLFALQQRGKQSFAGVLDQFLIAGLLLPLAEQPNAGSTGEERLYLLDPRRFSELKNSSLDAMARHSFLSVDMAVACAFSLQNLRPCYRPKDAERSRRPPLASGSAAPDLVAFDDLSLALDDGELIPLWDLDGSQAAVQLPAT